MNVEVSPAVASHGVVEPRSPEKQAARVADRTAFFTAKPSEETGDRTGELVEYDVTAKMFSNPADERTEAYISGRFG